MGNTKKPIKYGGFPKMGLAIKRGVLKGKMFKKKKKFKNVIFFQILKRYYYI